MWRKATIDDRAEQYLKLQLEREKKEEKEEKELKAKRAEEDRLIALEKQTDCSRKREKRQNPYSQPQRTITS